MKKQDTFASSYDRSDSIGAVSFSLKGSAEGQAKGKEVAKDIRSVTRHPVTVAVISATAGVAPPVGPAAAGIMTAGIGVAEGIAVLAAPLGSILGGIKIGKRRRRKGEERRGFLGVKIKGKRAQKNDGPSLIELAKEMSLEELTAQIEQLKKLSKYNPVFKVQASVLDTELKSRAKPAKLPPASSALTEEQKESATRLANVMQGARHGNERDQKTLVTLNMFQSEALVFARAYAALIADGVSESEAREQAKEETAATLDTWKLVTKRARAKLRNMTKPTSKTRKAPDPKKLAAAATAAAARLAGEAKKRSEPMTGVLVTDSGKLVSGKRPYVNKMTPDRKAKGGYLVLRNGRVIGGRWREV